MKAKTPPSCSYLSGFKGLVEALEVHAAVNIIIIIIITKTFVPEMCSR